MRMRYLAICFVCVFYSFLLSLELSSFSVLFGLLGFGFFFRLFL